MRKYQIFHPAILIYIRYWQYTRYISSAFVYLPLPSSALGNDEFRWMRCLVNSTNLVQYYKNEGQCGEHTYMRRRVGVYAEN